MVGTYGGSSAPDMPPRMPMPAPARETGTEVPLGTEDAMTLQFPTPETPMVRVPIEPTADIGPTGRPMPVLSLIHI